MIWVPGAVVVLSAGWLIGLAAAIWFTPARAARFLGSFASSARAHYTEQVLRLLAGLALIAFSSEMRFPDLFRAFGWILLATAVGLLCTPWRWHRRFADKVMAPAIRHMHVLAVGALALGALILYAVFAARLP